MFDDFIRSIALDNKIAAIAEENSHQALADTAIAESTIETIARELGLRHRHCDPDGFTRSSLGIIQENDIRATAFFENIPEMVVQQKIEESMRARERYWLEQILELNVWPTLFICGACHSRAFFELLQTSKIDTVLVSIDCCV